MGKRFGNALAFAGGGTTAAAVVDEAADVRLRMDYSRFGADEEFFRSRAISIYRSVRRGLQSRWEVGKAFAEIRDRSRYGEFGTILREEFGVDEEDGWSSSLVYDAMKLFDDFPEFERIAGLGLSAARVLTAGTTPQAAKEEILDRLARGERVGHGTATRIVRKYKGEGRPGDRVRGDKVRGAGGAVGGGRALAVEEAVALVWWRVKLATGAGSGAAVRLAWLEGLGAGSVARFRESLGAWRPGGESLVLEEGVFVRAFETVAAELQGQVTHAARKATRRGDGGVDGSVVEGEVVMEELPAALVARGWAVRTVGAGPKVYGCRAAHDGRRARVTPPCVDVAEVAARAWEIEGEAGLDSGVTDDDWVEVRVSRETVRVLAGALAVGGVRTLLGEAAWAELAQVLREVTG